MIPSIGPETLFMFAIGGLLIYLAIGKEYEPTLLLPIGFGVLLGNLPNSPMNQPGGMLQPADRVRHPHRALSALHLHRYRGDDGLSPAAVAAGVRAPRGRRPARHLRHPHSRHRLRVPPEPGGLDCRDRSHRRPHQHLRIVPARPGAAGPDRRHRLLLHESGPDHPAPADAAVHHEGGAPHPDGVRPASGPRGARSSPSPSW